MHLIYDDYVRDEYLDMNNHMGVNSYYIIFNKASSKFVRSLGFRVGEEGESLTLFTLESHLTYLKEIRKGEKFKIYMRVLEYDEKRIRFFSEMYNEQDDILATCESLVIGVDINTRKSTTFPDKIMASLKTSFESTEEEPWPKQAGKGIALTKRSKTAQ